MAKPWVHAESAAKRWGGSLEEYMPIQQLMDSTKKTFADNRHRALTHNSWFVAEVLPLIFGDTLLLSTGRRVSVADIGERHVLEDYGGKFIPSVQDWLRLIPLEEWMQNGRAFPPSSEAIANSILPPSRKD